MTKQRAAILKVMAENDGHFTAEEIFTKTKAVYPGIVRATIYNNLNALAQENQIRRICQSGQPDRFDRNPIPHEHIICTQCGEVVDVWIKDFKHKLQKELHLDVDDYELVIHCKCEKCKESIA
ncbi:MAG: transcriptional repressor [Clostridia bacterium]|nr:transcriptional repressor [Clostridia bacterium]MBR3974344.1 transcriptional repressor [Clostridia bacterium]